MTVTKPVTPHHYWRKGPGGKGGIKGCVQTAVVVLMQVGWRLQSDDEVTVAQPIHLPQHGPLLLGGGDPSQGSCDVVLESAVEAGPGVHARLEIFFSGRKPW